MVLGEVGLAGEIRRVPNIQRRLMEAQRLGYKRAIIPVSDPSETKVAGIKVIQVSDIREALDVAVG